MAEAFPVAIAGAGLMGRWHARYGRMQGASICGVIDPDRQAAERLAAKFPSAFVSADPRQLLDRIHPRVLHICTPLSDHAPIIEAALDAGVHVLAEKPLAGDAVTTERLLLLAERKGLILAPVHQFLFQRGFLEAQARLSKPARILHIDATFCSAGAAARNADEVALEVLPHPLAMIERLLPDALGQIDWRVLRAREGEWRITGMTASSSVSILISLHGRPTEATLRLITEQENITLDLFHGFASIDASSVSRNSKIVKPFRTSIRHLTTAAWNLTGRLGRREFAYPGLLDLIGKFYACVRTGSETPVGARETLAVARARDALHGLAMAPREQGGH
jgi:predicted dehydrogenase